MSGTKEGGKKAAATNKARYGEDFYKIQGSKGGRNGHTGGFYANRELARTAGAKGGTISRRSDTKKWWEEHRADVKSLEVMGYTKEQIAETLGVRPQKLYYAITQYGE